MKILRNKKGAALVAVLIGILFISILASSLLYMSTMNYQMKSMRQFSADNFYSAEFALDDMLAQINQFASIKTEPIKDLDTYLKNPTQVGGKTVFNEANLRQMIKVKDYVTGIDTIEVTSIYKNGTTYTRDTYKKSSNYIYLYGVQIIVTTDDAHGNYVSTITTDIALGFPQQSGGTANLNDFSILMDSPIFVNGGSPNFCSDVYARANGKQGRNALRVGGSDGGICSLLGQFSFFQGDVTVESGASLMFGGDCYINGDLILDGNAQVVVSGRVYVRGDVKLSGGAKAPILSGGTITKDQEQRTGDTWKPETNKNNTKVKWTDYDTKYGTGLAGKLVASEIKLHFAGNVEKSVSQEDFWQYICKGGNTGNGILATSKTNSNVHAWYLTNGVTNKTIKNTLIVSANSPTSYHGSVENSTWLITCNNGVLQIDGKTDNFMQVWGAMDDNSYELAKTLFVQAKPNMNFSGGLQNVFGGNDGTGGDDGRTVYGLDDITDDPHNDSTIKYLGSTKLHVYAAGNLGTDLQPYYYVDGAGDTILFPYNNFFSEKMEQVLSDFKYGLKGNGDTTAKPTIILNNWTKD